MRNPLFKLCALMSLLLASTAWGGGAIDTYEFDNEVDRKRYLSFIEEMRCPKCQNQNLSGSDSPIASDLRRELYTLIQDDRSDREIIDYMVDRYGEYILYRPRFNSSTILLWLGPLVLLLAGIIALIWVVSRRRSHESEAESPNRALSGAERARLDELLTANADKPNHNAKKPPQ